MYIKHLCIKFKFGRIKHFNSLFVLPHYIKLVLRCKRSYSKNTFYPPNWSIMFEKFIFIKKNYFHHLINTSN